MNLNFSDIQNNKKITVFGGINVLESYDLAALVCERFLEVTSKYNLNYVFKASFDKANRSSINSYRGVGLKDGIDIFKKLKKEFNVDIITDVHEVYQADEIADVADVLQIPAFLARQTDLVVAIAKTNKIINVKKPQFLAPLEMKHIIKKINDAGNDKVMLCERGSCFGYNNLVVDMLGVDLMKNLAPVIIDATHALQKPGARESSADGRSEQSFALMRSSVALSIAGIFLETHPDPSKALCDGPCALKLDDLDR